MASRSKRFLAGFLFLLTTLLFTIIGFGIALFYDANSQLVYESRAIFRVVPNWVAGEGSSDEKVQQLVEILDAPHQQTITSSETVKYCLESNNLKVLDCFQGVGEQERVAQTVENLEINELASGSRIFRLVFRTTDPNDAQTILNNLVESYKKTFANSSPELADDYTFEILEYARYGEQVSPVLPITLASFVFPAIILSIVIWFLVNPFRFRYPRLSIVPLLVLFLMTLFFVAVTLGLAWWAEGVSEFESSATVMFDNATLGLAQQDTDTEKRLAALSSTSHQLSFQQYKNIELGLARNNLFVLDTFKDYAKEDCIELVQHNLKISQSENDGPYEIRFRSEHELDCQTILSNLINSYSKSVKQQHSRIQERIMNPDKLAGDAGGGDLQSRTPILTNVKILRPASKGEPVLRMPARIEPYVFLAVLAGLFSLVLWCAWRATNDDTPDVTVKEKAGAV